VGGVSPTPGPGDPRPYELRVGRIADAAVRDRLARLLVERFPPRELEATRVALAGPGLLIRTALREPEAPALARELYEAGVPPAALVLLPAALSGRRPEQDTALDRAFALFDSRGGAFVPTWNWAAFVFGPLWYFRKGLFAKGAILLVVVVVPVFSLSITLLVQLSAFFYCGLVGNWDDYLLEVRRTQWW
jgi:Protein of unknown function (DUF2628)